MADSISNLILRMIKRDCRANTCPYRQGDGEHSSRIATKLDTGLKHRVSDGNHVKKLEEELKDLKTLATKLLEAGRKRRLNPQEIHALEKMLKIELK